MNRPENMTKLLKEHLSKETLRKEMQEKRKSEAVVAAQKFTNVIVDQLNENVARAYQNQKRLDVEAKKLENNSIQLQRIAEQWIETIDTFAYALKEIGNVESWSRAIEKDCTIIARTLEEAHKAEIARS